MWKERNTMKLIDSPFCLKLHASFATEKKLCNVYQLLSGTCLDWQWPHGQKMEDNFETRIFLASIAAGIRDH